MRQNVSLTEDWHIDAWTNWDTYGSTTTSGALGRNASAQFPFGLLTQHHIDVRNFREPGGWTAPSATQGYIAGLNNWPGLTTTLSIGTHTVLSNYTQPVDLTTIGTDGNLVLGIPDFPLGSVDLSNSHVELSSDGFVNDICTLVWSASTTAPIAGDSTLTWPYAALTGIDLTAVTGVRIIIKNTGSCTVTLTALRVIGPSWTQTNVDFDNLAGQLRPCIPLNGDITAVPVTGNHVVPPLWRVASVPGVDDPRPINSEISFLFNTGSQTMDNSFVIYMREVTKAFITQLDLQGTLQSNLDGTTQEDLSLGISEKSPRTMSDLDQYTVGTLDTQPMANLEAIHNPTFTSWMSFRVAWGLHTRVQITNSVKPNDGYVYTNFSLSNNTTYAAICNLTDNQARLQIFKVNQVTLAIGDPVFDTTVIPDSFVFPRRAGRIGFQAILQDGDTYIGAIRPRSLMFAEYRSAPLSSLTPVKGARLYLGASPDISLFTGWDALADSQNHVPLVLEDQQRFMDSHLDGHSTRVVVTSPSTTEPAQGVISNTLSPSGDPIGGITNFDELHIGFSLWVPDVAIQGGTLNDDTVIGAALVSASGDVVPINLPTIIPNQWQTISLFQPVSQPYPQSGPYQLALYYQGVVATAWWIDAVNIHQRAIRYDARSVVDDPWHSNYAPWTNFHETLNSDTSGVTFTTQGSDLQMRIQALKQDAAILSPPKLVPQYAELGRLVWPEQAPAVGQNPIAAITASSVGRAYTFNGSTSSGTTPITNYLWDFGDGTRGSGGVAHHTYASWIPGGTDFTVNLTVVDASGLIDLAESVVTL